MLHDSTINTETEHNHSRKHALLAASAVLLVFTGCAQAPMARTTRPVERPDTEIIRDSTGLIRTIHCDVYVTHLDTAMWDTFRRQDAFMKKKPSARRTRDPELTGFFAVIRNTSRYPVALSDTRVRYGENAAPSLNDEEIQKICSSPAYSQYDFHAITALRRVRGTALNPDAISIDRDTLPGGGDTIPPEESAAVVLLFNTVPVQYRDVKLELTVSSRGEKKVIDFDFHRGEYRLKGNYFLRQTD